MKINAMLSLAGLMVSGLYLLLLFNHFKVLYLLILIGALVYSVSFLYWWGRAVVEAVTKKRL